MPSLSHYTACCSGLVKQIKGDLCVSQYTSVSQSVSVSVSEEKLGNNREALTCHNCRQTSHQPIRHEARETGPQWNKLTIFFKSTFCIEIKLLQLPNFPLIDVVIILAWVVDGQALQAGVVSLQGLQERPDHIALIWRIRIDKPGICIHPSGLKVLLSCFSDLHVLK